MRVDGSVKANARLAHDGVILSFEHPKAGPLSYPCDTFTGSQIWVAGQPGRGGGAYRSVPGWQMNVRAIVLGLEALRKVDRYGIAGHGQQYAGWRAIGTGELETRPMTEQEAMDFLAAHSGMTYFATCDSPRTAYRLAAKALHPDSGAVDGEAFKQLQEARRALKIGLR